MAKAQGGAQGGAQAKGRISELRKLDQDYDQFGWNLFIEL